MCSVNNSLFVETGSLSAVANLKKMVLIMNKNSVERLRATSASPSSEVIYCRNYFIPTNNDLQVVFHSQLKSVTLMINRDKWDGDAETVWLRGLKRQCSLTQLTKITLSGTFYDEDDCYPPHYFPHLSLANHLTTSLQQLEFNSLVFEKNSTPLLARALPLFKTIRHVSIVSSSVEAPCGALVNAVDYSPWFFVSLLNCRCEQALLQCRFEHHRGEATTKRKGYFDVSNWSAVSIIQRAVNKQMVSLMEKCGSMKTSHAMLKRLPQQDASMLRQFLGKLEW